MGYNTAKDNKEYNEQSTSSELEAVLCGRWLAQVFYNHIQTRFAQLQI